MVQVRPLSQEESKESTPRRSQRGVSRVNYRDSVVVVRECEGRSGQAQGSQRQLRVEHNPITTIIPNVSDDSLIVDLPIENIHLILHISTSMLYMPVSIIGPVREAFIFVMEKLELELVLGDQGQALLSFKKFMLLGVVLLSKMYSKTKEVAKEIKRRVELILKDDWSYFKIDMFCKRPSKLLRKKGQLLTEAQAKAQYFMKHGMLSKASDSLKESVQPEMSDLTWEKLISLHPKRTDNNNMPQILMPEGYLHTLENEDMLKVIRGFPKLKSPSINKLRMEHLQQMVGRDDNHGAQIAFRNALRLFLIRLINGDLPQIALKFMANGEISAIAKTLNPQGPIRPIANGDIFRKIVASILLTKHKTQIVEVLGTNQLGVGQSNGMESIIHLFNASLEADQTWDLVSIDIRNAFNSIFRKIILVNLSVKFPSMLSYFKTFYYEKNIMWYNMLTQIREVLSEEGGMQGDSLMPFFFALGYSQLLSDMKLHIPNGILKAYLDDTAWRGPSDECLSVLQFIMREGSQYGIELQEVKTKVLIGRKESAQVAKEVRERYKELLGVGAVVLIHPDNLQQQERRSEMYGIQILGTPVGSLEFVHKWLQQYALNLREEGQRIIKYPDSQGQWLLLYYSFQNKVTHLMRVLQPSVLREFLIVFQEMKRNIFQEIVKGNLGDIQWEQSKLPINAGGCGLTDALLVYELAYLASVMGVMTVIMEELRGLIPAFILVESGWGIEVEIIKVKFRGEEDLSVLSIKGLQRTLCKPVIQKEAELFYTRVLDLENEEIYFEDRARLIGVQNSKSGAFLRVIPKQAINIMSSVEFQIAVQIRLGMNIPFIGATRICNCQAMASIEGAGHHLAGCVKGSRSRTHDHIRDVIVAFFLSAGIKAICEPYGLFRVVDETNPRQAEKDRNKRPDIRLVNDGRFGEARDILLDISVTYAGGKTNVETHNSHIHQGASAAATANNKHRKYDNVARSNQFLFIPVVFESNGLWGKEWEELFNRYVGESHKRIGGKLGAVRDYWIRTISVALHKWNARNYEDHINAIQKEQFGGGNIYSDHHGALDDRVFFRGGRN